ncbi:uncharacterized protein BCR38DRAFT_474505 [Pseudomassariella vexata]|uniref:Uncharacterized protein n=1 Tax=Pseudomassariella vexata TaxID=1141098 RepID=A0A1Y2DXD7_9PEZI|nr:uncharacterized protein BCR38DRAFT_474505 [Pseudomassariella vexata]ORY63933.1 hypothetical protein BCR38DRAFT_474505 [Pseudomassariella vexata]
MRREMRQSIKCRFAREGLEVRAMPAQASRQDEPLVGCRYDNMNRGSTYVVNVACRQVIERENEADRGAEVLTIQSCASIIIRAVDSSIEEETSALPPIPDP